MITSCYPAKTDTGANGRLRLALLDSANHSPENCQQDRHQDRLCVWQVIATKEVEFSWPTFPDIVSVLNQDLPPALKKSNPWFRTCQCLFQANLTVFELACNTLNSINSINSPLISQINSAPNKFCWINCFKIRKSLAISTESVRRQKLWTSVRKG